MTKITDIFGGPFVPEAGKQVDPPDVQVADAMFSAGIEPPEDIKIDGKLHRFSTNGRKRDDSGYLSPILGANLRLRKIWRSQDGNLKRPKNESECGRKNPRLQLTRSKKSGARRLPPALTIRI